MCRFSRHKFEPCKKDTLRIDRNGYVTYLYNMSNAHSAGEKDMESVMASGVGGMLMVVLVIWAILMMFAPFFWYGTNSRTKETSKKLDIIINLMKERC